jgi:hypothetical protein
LRERPDAPRDLPPHELAALLRQLFADRHLSARHDRQGRRVFHVAAQAMQALGPPYSQQIPERSFPISPGEHLKNLLARILPPAPSALPKGHLSRVLDRRISVGLVLLAVVTALEWAAFISAAIIDPKPPPQVQRPPPGEEFACAPMSSIPRVRPLSTAWSAAVVPGLFSLLPLLFALRARRAWRPELLRYTVLLLWLGAAARLLFWAVDFRVESSEASFVLLLTGTVMGAAGLLFMPMEENPGPAVRSAPVG